MTKPADRGSIFFAFADSVGFSGQKAATELVLNGLSRRGWLCRRLPMPVLRDSGRRTSAIGFLSGLAVAWLRTLRISWKRGSWLYVSLGQSRFSFLRDLIPILVGRAALGRTRVIILLQGSLFMRW